MYPVMLDVSGRRCLVVGGGGVALRKVGGLLSEGAQVTVVASEPMPAMVELAESGQIELQGRPYQSPEAAEYFVVFSATDDREVNRQVSDDAEAAGVWANSADDPELCTFHLPARLERGALQLAIASGGEAPFVVRRLRRIFEQRFGPEWAEWIEAAGRFRDGVRALELPVPEMEERYDAFFEGTLDTRRWRARVPTEAEMRTWLEAPGARFPETELAAPAAPPQVGNVTGGEGPGLVSLVGAGPGDPGLLTRRAEERLRSADVVVYDRLAETALPCDLPATVELHCVGKQSNEHPVPQEEINALLVRLGRKGLRVVRFKGGDPFVFGRGSEEAEELVKAGIPFEVVPSVTAGVAAPAYAGIPVTHRGQAVRFTIVTAHEAIKTSGPQVRWDLMAADPAATILGYMGVKALGKVVRELRGGGMNPDTPAAMIQRGTTSQQRMVRTTLKELPAAVRAAGLKPPGLFVIGPTVEHAATLDWFSSRPLFGQRLVLAAPAGALRAELELAGVEVVEVPLPVTPVARVVMSALPLTGCVLRTADEVESLDGERSSAAWSPEVVTWCIGADAARRARELGWPNVEELPTTPGEGGVVAAMLEQHATEKV